MRVNPANFPLNQSWEEKEHGDGWKVSMARFVHVLLSTYLISQLEIERESTNGSQLSTPTPRILEWMA